MTYNFWEDKLDLKCIRLDAELERRAKIAIERRKKLMKIKSKEEIERLRELYPKGTRIVLEYMDDYQAPPKGTVGEVTNVDDMGQIHWTGSGLALNTDVDRFYRIDKMGWRIDENGKRID